MEAAQKWFLVLLAFVLPFMATDAFAYLNPGVGSLILQGLLGLLFVGLAVWGLFWKRIRKLLDRVAKRNE